MTKRMDGENNIVMRAASVIFELFLLNILTVLCSLPIITGGAALTALHDGLIRILRKEDGYVARRYFAVFKENLKPGILLYLPFLLIFAGVLADIFIQRAAPELLPDYVKIPAGAAGILSVFFFQWIFPLQARFRGSVGQVFRMGFFLAGARFPRTIAMTMMWVLPLLGTKYIFTLPIVLVFGVSLPAFLCALFYYPVFRELEEEEDDKDKKVS